MSYITSNAKRYNMAKRCLALALSMAMVLPIMTQSKEMNYEIHEVKAAETGSDVVYGDVNSDGKITILDMIVLKSYLTEKNEKGFSVKAADLDEDGEVSAKDAAELTLYLLNQTETFSYEIYSDSDEDGLCDYLEKEFLKTDYMKKDTDGDGLDDYAEVYLCETDPLKIDSDDSGIKDSLKDADGDKITNADEIKLGTSPMLSDTDNDGISDYDEVNKYKTDPLKSDTDGDGIDDVSEIELDLDPLKSKSDGKTDDAERTFSQEIKSDSELLKEINSENESYSFSVSATVSGKLERSLEAVISKRTDYLKNDSIAGNIIDIDYEDNLIIENLRLSFNVPNKAEDYFVFRYFEDVNMLLPIETGYDGNTVYADCAEDGTFCIIDLNKWTGATDTESVTQMAYESELYGAEKTSEALEVYFLMYINAASSVTSARNSVAVASRTIINHCNQINRDVRIYYAGYTGSTVVSKETGNSYVSNSSTDEEIAEMLSRTGSAPAALDTSDFSYSLTKTLKKSLLDVSGLDAKSKKYCFVVDVNFQPQSSSYIAVVDEMKNNGVSFSFICNKSNDNIDNYKMLSSVGDYYEWKPDFSSVVINKVSSEIADVVSYYYATGLFSNTIIPSEVTYDWYKAAKGLLTAEEIKKLNLPDSDGDGIYDYEEINWDYVDFVDGKLVLPTFKQLCDHYEISKKGAQDFEMLCKLHNISFDASKIKVLALKSSLISDDSDGDGLLDGDGVNKWGLSIKDPEPTVKNNFVPFGTKSYLEETEKVYPLNTEAKVKYMMNQVNTAEYYDLIPFEYWDAFCNYFNSQVCKIAIDEDIHYFRVKLNRAPKTLDDMMEPEERVKWTLLDANMARYHMYPEKACKNPVTGEDEGHYNLKFVSLDGKYEAVYNHSGELLDEHNDPVNMGTYNYNDPYGPVFGVKHAFTDVFPYSNELYQQALSKLVERSSPTGLGNVPGVYINCAESSKNLDTYDKDDEAKEWHNKHADGQSE